MQTILVVDDAPDVLMLLDAILKPYYKTVTANSGQRALASLAGAQKPDLALLDVAMPVMDGYAVFRRMAADPATAAIPVIFVTGMDSASDEEASLSMGAADYITKPIRPAVVLARVKAQLAFKAARDALAAGNAALQTETDRLRQENFASQRLAAFIFAGLASLRERGAGQRLHRVQGYVRVLCAGLRTHPRFRDALTNSGIEILCAAVPLYDIGKLLVPDEILAKRGELTPGEWRVLRERCALGGQVLERALEMAAGNEGHPVAFLMAAEAFAMRHTEKWDGSGHPDGLSGEKIPLAARLLALAAAFDGMIHQRPYKDALPVADACRVVLAERGAQFDPDVVDAFLARFGEIQAIMDQHPDE